MHLSSLQRAVEFILVLLFLAATVIHQRGFPQSHTLRMVSFVSSLDSEERLFDALPTRPLNVTDGSDFTIVAVLTQNRLFFFDYLLRLWPGRFVFVLFYYGYEEETIRRFFSHRLFPHRMLVVFYSDPTPPNAYSHFPVNKMRNLGIANVQTSHFIVTDMDLWPSRNVYSELQSIPPFILKDDRAAIILPVFFYASSVLNHTDSFEASILRGYRMYPESKAALERCVEAKTCCLRKPGLYTHMFVNPSWFRLPRNESVMKVACIPNYEQEPYYVLRKTNATPRFDERFMDYGYNKMQHMRHLLYEGYRFFVLSNCYAVDMPHTESRFKARYRSRSNDTRQLYMEFLYDRKWLRGRRQRERFCARNEHLSPFFYQSVVQWSVCGKQER